MTSRESTRWVPISTSILPSAILAQRRLDLAASAHARDGLDAQREVAEAVAEGLQVLLREQRRRREHEHLPPALATRNAARSATSVLPKPTSPQIRRSIGCSTRDPP